MSADDYTARFDPSPGDGVWARFRAWFAVPPETVRLGPYTPDREQTCRQEPAEPLTFLADGDAFEFKVFPTYEWRGYADTREHLEDRAVFLRPHARRRAIHLLRPMARNHPPHRARDFEAAVNKRTDGEWWSIRDEDGDQYWFTFMVRAEPDERVQEQMRPYWAARIKADCDHALGLQRAQQADELTRRWSAIFDNLADDPRATHAAKLSEQDFAEVFGTFVGDQQKAVHDILRLLRDAVKGNLDAGLGPSEYTRAWDQALQAFQKQYGLKVTESD